MGIDIYARWPKMTQAQARAQVCGFDTTMGAAGYLREAYHGAPYATRVLLPECWEDNRDSAACDHVGWAAGVECAVCYNEPDGIRGRRIPPATLRARLPEVLAAFDRRMAAVYPGEPTDDPVTVKMRASYEDFVALCERVEAETGEAPLIHASY